MAGKMVLSVKSDRRTALRAGGLLAATAGLSATKVRAQDDDATPETEDADKSALLGSHCVIRGYVIKDDADVNGLIDLVAGGFVDIISQVDGFEEYFVVYNDETRQWTAINVFADKAGADQSTADAADYVAENDIAGYLVDTAPTVVEGDLVVASTADHEGHEH